MTPRSLYALPLIAALSTGCSGGGDDEPSVDQPNPVPTIADSGDDIEPAPSDGSPFEPVGTATDSDELPLDDVAPDVADNGPIDQAPVGTSGDTAGIAGFWDVSRVLDAGADTVYVHIDEAGTVTTLDYQADAVGTGQACYERSVSRIAARGDDRYDIADSSSLPGARSPDDVIIVVEAGEIVFRYLGEVFDPEFGTGESGIEKRFPASTAGDPDTLTLCEEA